MWHISCLDDDSATDRHDICQICYTSIFSKIQNFPPKKLNCNISSQFTKRITCKLTKYSWAATIYATRYPTRYPDFFPLPYPNPTRSQKNPTRPSLLGRCLDVLEWYSWTSEALGCVCGASGFSVPAVWGYNTILAKPWKTQFFFPWPYWDIKISKCRYIRLTKMIGFYDFSIF